MAYSFSRRLGPGGLALLVAVLAAGCGDDDGGPITPIDSGTGGDDASVEMDAGVETDAATETDAGPDLDGGAGIDGAPDDDAGAMADAGDVDAGPLVPSVTADDQNLTDLSTVVVVAEVVSEGAGWIVIHEDASGAPGPAIGHAAVSAGTNTDVSVTLDRPAVDETLHAMLHVDAGAAGTYEFPGADAPVMTGGMTVMDPFVVTVADGTPAIRINVSAMGITSWVVDSVEPAAYSTDVLGSSDPDPPLRLEAGWRYEVANTVATAHPFELITRGATSTTDIVQLSQSGSGALEGNAAIDWNESGSSVFFTVAGPFTTAINGYRCALHVAQMRGNITYP